MPPQFNPYANDAAQGGTYESGFEAGYANPQIDETPPIAPELMDVYLEGREAGRAQAHSEANAPVAADDAAILDVFWKGVQFAYNHPGEQSGTPYAEPLLTAFNIGVASGQSARSGTGMPGSGAVDLSPPYDGPSAGPYISGGKSWEEYQKELQELLEPLFHQHMPHIEVEPFEMPVPPPGVL